LTTGVSNWAKLIFLFMSEYEKLVSLENLLRAWQKFKIGKNRKRDVMAFERRLEDSLFALYQELKEKTYRHGGYEYFSITDPKKCSIHKAKVRDRIVHQAVFDYLSKIYESVFSENSFSSRKEKGTHRAMKKLAEFANEIHRKNRGLCFAIKGDVRKYFDSVDHNILLEILREKIKNDEIFRLLEKIIRGFQGKTGKGMPLGNITSQIFANIYLNELDEFCEKRLRLKYYLRYNDDFVILDADKEKLRKIAKIIRIFVKDRLCLDIPKEKTVFRKLKWGIDFCGYIILPKSVLLRQKTKKRMLKNISVFRDRIRAGEASRADFSKTADSYFGLLKHCNSYNLKEKIKCQFIYEEFGEDALL